jgi:hypothetical protein
MSNVYVANVKKCSSNRMGERNTVSKCTLSPLVDILAVMLSHCNPVNVLAMGDLFLCPFEYLKDNMYRNNCHTVN